MLGRGRPFGAEGHEDESAGIEKEEEPKDERAEALFELIRLDRGAVPHTTSAKSRSSIDSSAAFPELQRL
jgi:hypothetical protein